MAHFNIDEYETVDQRLKRFKEQFPDYRVKTEIAYQQKLDEMDVICIKATLFKTSEEQEKGLFISTGIAEEKRGDGHVNKSAHVENCETSAIGRALANAGFSGMHRPSREEMAKVSMDTILPTAPTGMGKKCPGCGKSDWRPGRNGKEYCFTCWQRWSEQNNAKVKEVISTVTKT